MYSRNAIGDARRRSAKNVMRVQDAMANGDIVRWGVETTLGMRKKRFRGKPSGA
jgi:hypothetical protein